MAAEPSAAELTTMVISITETTVYVWHPFDGTFFARPIASSTTDVGATQLTIDTDFTSLGFGDLSSVAALPVPEEA